MRLRQLTLAWLMALGLTAYAQNPVQKVAQVDGTVDLTNAVDYTITGEEPFATMGSIDIVNPDATVVFEKVQPSAVVSTYLQRITCNGVALTDGTNCRVSIYRAGAIVFVHSDNKNADGTPFYPVTMYSDDACTEVIGNYNGTGRNISGPWVNKARAFTLKRGYMCTVANDAGGTGYSHCYIANSQDRTIVLPKELAGKLGFFRIFRWQWPTKLGMGDARADELMKLTNSSWYYDWGAGRSSKKNAEYVPQRHHESGQSNSNGYKGAWESWDNINASDNTCTHVLGQNEPDNTSGGNEVFTYVLNIPADAREKHGDYPLVDVADKFLYSGKRIGTFACCNPSTGWVSDYVNWCRQNNIRVDFVATHYYIGGQSPQGCIDRLWSLYNATGLPVWVTEWNNGANWTTESGFSTDSEGWYSWGTGNDQHKNGVWMKDVLVRADKPENKWLERLAVYNAVEGKREIWTNGQPTDAARVLATYTSSFAYTDGNEYFMPWNHKDPTNLTATYNASKKTVTLSWTHSNTKQTDSICVQRKEPDGQYVTIRNLGMKENGTVTMTDDVSDLVGAILYKICDYDTDKKKRYTNEATVDVAPAQGTSEIQYGRLTIPSTDETTVLYSAAFSTTPCVFMGTMTNKNSSFYAGNKAGKTSNSQKFTYELFPWQTKESTFSKSEEVPFLALKPGNYKYGDLDCEVGQTNSNKASNELWTEPTEVTFQQAFPEGVTPVVLVEIKSPSYTTASPMTALCARVFEVTNTGFKFIVYPEYASGRQVMAPQKVAYLAITPGFGMVDEENGIMIAAGHGTDNSIYGSSLRENYFRVDRYDETEGIQQEQLYLYQPTIFTGLQTNNYPAICMLRRSDVTIKDESRTSWTTGVRVKRVLDHDLTVDNKTIRTTTADEAYFDQLGWVVIANYKEGGSIPTDIDAVPADELVKGKLTPRVVNGRVYVNGTTSFEIYTTTGKKMAKDSTLPTGIYVVKAGKQTAKILVK